MNKAVKQRAKYIVNAMVGEDRSESSIFPVRELLKVLRNIRANYWLWKVNHMSEGEILDMYYLLTDRRQA